jgi:hypothetical protein
MQATTFLSSDLPAAQAMLPSIAAMVIIAAVFIDLASIARPRVRY